MVFGELLMKIRKYKEGDEGKISKLIRDALENHRYDFRGQDPRLIECDIKRYSSEYVNELASKTDIFLAVTEHDDQDIIGFVCLDGDELSSCYTRSDMQKKRIGTTLVEYVENLARKRGLKKLKLYSNFYSEQFYESCGFELVERVTVDYYGVPWNASYMEKEL